MLGVAVLRLPCINLGFCWCVCPPLIIYDASAGFEVVVQELVRIEIELRTAAGG